MGAYITVPAFQYLYFHAIQCAREKFVVTIHHIPQTEKDNNKDILLPARYKENKKWN